VSTAAPGFLSRLRSGGILPGDSAEERLNKSLLLATGLVCVASMLWLAVYWSIGPQLSATLPFAHQLLLAGNLLLYVRSGNFELFRKTQLGLFLFVPFVAQWAIGNFITASGILLWGLLAPVGAILCIGACEALAWFFAYAFLIVLTGGFDFYLADASTYRDTTVSVETSVVFFALNFLAISTIVFMLLRFAIDQNQRTASLLAEAHALLESEQERSERLLLNILPGPVAERLKQNEKNIADGFADVSVMFADIVNFTQVAAGMTPAQVFSMLNRVFSRFDEQAGARGLEKIKTIGDAYMVAGGLNENTSDYTSRAGRSGAGNARLAEEPDHRHRHAARSAHRHRHWSGRRRRGRQEEIHLRPVGRHRQSGQSHHHRRRARHGAGRHHHLPSPAQPF